MDLLNRICSRVIEDRHNYIQFSRENSPIVTATMAKGEGGFGFNFVGPTSSADVLTGEKKKNLLHVPHKSVVLYIYKESDICMILSAAAMLE